MPESFVLIHGESGTTARLAGSDFAHTLITLGVAEDRAAHLASRLMAPLLAIDGRVGLETVHEHAGRLSRDVGERALCLEALATAIRPAETAEAPAVRERTRSAGVCAPAVLAYDHLFGVVGRSDPEFATFGRGLIRLCDWAVNTTLAEQEGALAGAVAAMDGVTEEDVARIREVFRAKLAVEPVSDELLAGLEAAYSGLFERRLMSAEDPVGAWTWGMRWGLLDGFARGGTAVGLPPRTPAPEAGPEPPTPPTPAPPTYRVVGALERPARLNGWKPLWQRRAIEHGPGEADDLFAENAPYTKLPYRLLDGDDNAPSLRNVDGHWLDEQALVDELPTTYSFKLPNGEQLYHYVFQLTELSAPPAGSWADWALKIAQWLTDKEDDLADGAGKLVGGAVAAVAPPAADIAKEIVKGLTKLAINLIADGIIEEYSDHPYPVLVMSHHHVWNGDPEGPLSTVCLARQSADGKAFEAIPMGRRMFLGQHRDDCAPEYDDVVGSCAGVSFLAEDPDNNDRVMLRSWRGASREAGTPTAALFSDAIQTLPLQHPAGSFKISFGAPNPESCVWADDDCGFHAFVCLANLAVPESRVVVALRDDVRVG